MGNTTGAAFDGAGRHAYRERMVRWGFREVDPIAHAKQSRTINGIAVSDPARVTFHHPAWRMVLPGK